MSSAVQSADLPPERGATCSCGASYTQKRFGAQYFPAACEPCGAKKGSALRDSLNRAPSAIGPVLLPPRRSAEEERRIAERVAEEEQRIAERDAKHEAERREKSLRELATPRLYADVSLSTFDTAHTDPDAERTLSRVKTLALRYVADWDARAELRAVFPQVVILRGGVGTGKGHVAWSIARAVVVEHVASVRVVKCSDLVRDLRESWRRGSEAESEAQRLKRYRELDLLVIDEVSRHALFGEPVQHLYDVIDHRHEWLRPTILTTNEAKGGVAELLGPALVSRASSWGGVWEFGEVDRRADWRRQMLAARGAA